MSQVCNVAYASQLDGMLEEEERIKFIKELYAHPSQKARASHVTAELDALMAPPSMRRGRQ